MRRAQIIASVLFALTGPIACGDHDAPRTGPGAPDAGGGEPSDIEAGVDVGGADAEDGGADSGGLDAAAGERDADGPAEPDASELDAGGPGEPDAGRADAGVPDAGGPDAGDPVDPIAQLAGDEDADAWAAIPDLDPPVLDPAALVSFQTMTVAADRLLVFVAEGATVGDVNRVLRERSLHVLRGSPVTGMLSLRADEVDGLRALFDLADALNEEPVVAHASIVAVDEARLLPPHHFQRDWAWDAGGGANWGWKVSRVPGAWNLRDRARRKHSPPFVGIVDAGYVRHADVPLELASGDTHTGETHGSAVAGVLGAYWDDAGTEGVFPSDASDAPRPRLELTMVGDAAERSTTDGALKMFERLLRTAASRGFTRAVLNYSMGPALVSFDELPGGRRRLTMQVDPTAVDPATGRTWRQLQDGLGRGLHLATTRWHDRILPQFLLFCAAGNDSIDADFAGTFDGPTPTIVTYDSRDAGACPNAAAQQLASHVLSVEAIDSNLRPAGFSVRGGDLSAPGVAVGAPLELGQFGAVSGTSFASPFAAGAAALLWAIEPALEYHQVRRALVEAAVPVAGGAPRVDVLGAALRIDTLLPHAGVKRDLADLDDGTADGNLREPDRWGHHAADVIATRDALRGDGCVDMADVRALRDALVDAREPGTAWLDGPADHFNRDLNGDGQVAHVSDEPFVAAEARGARHDLNGDDAVTHEDLDVMSDAFGACADPQARPRTEGRSAAGIRTLGGSADYWIELPGDAPSDLDLPGSFGRFDPSAEPELFLDADAGWLLLTSPLPCLAGDATKVTACRTTVRSRGGGTVTEKGCETVLALRAGSDADLDLPTVPEVDGFAYLSKQRTRAAADALIAYVPAGGGAELSLPGTGEQIPGLAGMPVLRHADGRLAYPGCGDRIGRTDSPQCVTVSDPTTGDHVAIPSDQPGGAIHFELLEWMDDGRILVQSQIEAQLRLFVADPAALTWSPVASDYWSQSREAMYVGGGFVYFAGGVDGDRDSNGVQRTMTDSLLGLDRCLLPLVERLAGLERTLLRRQGGPGPGGRYLTGPLLDPSAGLAVNAPDGERLVEVAPRTDAAAWSPDGALLAVSGLDYGTRIVSLGPGELWDAVERVQTVDVGPAVGRLFWSPDGSRLLVVDDERGAGGDNLADLMVVDVRLGDGREPQVAGYRRIGETLITHGAPVWAADSRHVLDVRAYSATLPCPDPDRAVEVFHHDIVAWDAVDVGEPARLTADRTIRNPDRPECGDAWPTSEWRPLR